MLDTCHALNIIFYNVYINIVQLIKRNILTYISVKKIVVGNKIYNRCNKNIYIMPTSELNCSVSNHRRRPLNDFILSFF